jgi:hypothetical protein
LIDLGLDGPMVGVRMAVVARRRRVHAKHRPPDAGQRTARRKGGAGFVDTVPLGATQLVRGQVTQHTTDL